MPPCVCECVCVVNSALKSVKCNKPAGLAVDYFCQLQQATTIKTKFKIGSRTHTASKSEREREEKRGERVRLNSNLACYSPEFHFVGSRMIYILPRFTRCHNHKLTSRNLHMTVARALPLGCICIFNAFTRAWRGAGKREGNSPLKCKVFFGGSCLQILTWFLNLTSCSRYCSFSLARCFVHKLARLVFPDCPAP